MEMLILLYMLARRNQRFGKESYGYDDEFSYDKKCRNCMKEIRAQDDRPKAWETDKKVVDYPSLSSDSE